MKKEIIRSNEFIVKLAEAVGLEGVPLRRIVVDVCIGEAPKVYSEAFASKEKGVEVGLPSPEAMLHCGPIGEPEAIGVGSLSGWSLLIGLACGVAGVVLGGFLAATFGG